MWTRGLSSATAFILAAIHNVFHISQLKKCIRVPTEIIDKQELLVEPDLYYVEYPLRILDQKERGTHRKVVKCIKFSGHTTLKKRPLGRWTIISIDIIRVFLASPQVSYFPYLNSIIQSRVEILFKGGRL